MVFRYAGKIEQLTDEVRTMQNRLNNSYFRILGNERYEKVDEISKKVLTPNGVYEDISKLYRDLGIEGPNFQNPMHILGNHPCFNEAGLEKILLTSFFHLPEKSLINSPYNNPQSKISYLATYIHEFNHFVFDVLQEPPAILFSQESFMDDGFVVRNEEDFSKFIDMINQSDEELAIKREWADNVMSEFYIDFYQEAGTRILDTMVINSIGYKFSHDWRGKKGEYLTYTPQGFSKSYSIPVTNTDAFLGVRDLDVVDRVVDWQNNFYIPHSDPEISQLIKESKNVPLEFISPEEFLKVRRENRVSEY